MGSKKDQALELLAEMRGFILYHTDKEPDLMYRMLNMVDDLKDIIDEIDQCSCGE